MIIYVAMGLIVGACAFCLSHFWAIEFGWAFAITCGPCLVGVFGTSIWWQNYVHERRMRFYRARGFMSRKITELEIKLNDAVALNHQLRFRCFDLERERSEHSAPSVSPPSNV